MKKGAVKNAVLERIALHNLLSMSMAKKELIYKAARLLRRQKRIGGTDKNGG